MRCCMQDEVVVGVPIAWRDHAETHPLVGYFINTLPIRGQLALHDSLAAVAQRAAQSTVLAVEHSLLPLQQVVAATRAERVGGANPLFQAMLQYLPDEGVLKELAFEGSGPVRLVDTPNAHAKMDIAFNLDGRGRLDVEYMAELYDAATVQRLAAAFVRLLEAAGNAPQTLAASVPLLTAEDERLFGQLVSGEMRPDYLHAPLTVQRFEAVVAAHPQHVALLFEGQEMTYGEVRLGVQCSVWACQLSCCSAVLQLGGRLAHRGVGYTLHLVW